MVISDGTQSIALALTLPMSFLRSCVQVFCLQFYFAHLLKLCLCQNEVAKDRGDFSFPKKSEFSKALGSFLNVAPRLIG